MPPRGSGGPRHRPGGADSLSIVMANPTALMAQEVGLFSLRPSEPPLEVLVLVRTTGNRESTHD